MSNSTYKLFEIVATLNEKEVRQLRRMLQSSFFTQRKELQNLFELLWEKSKKGKAAPTLDDLGRQLFPGDIAAAIKLRGAMSDLKKYIEECWCINMLRKDKIKMQQMVSEVYRRRKLQKCYLSNSKRIDQLLEVQPKRNAEYYQRRLDFETDQMKYQSSTKRTEHLFLQEISDTNDRLYLIQKLQNACAQLSHQLVFKTNYDQGLLRHLMEIIDQDKYLQHPAIAIYYYCFRFLTESENLDYFQKFKEQLSNYRDQFTPEDLGAPYRLAINFCIRKSNQGEDAFTRDGWELYKEGLSSGILFENDFIPRFTFNNAIALALILAEYEWIDLFVQKNAQYLEENFREQTISFNLARLEFERKNFGKALLHLQSSEYKDLINNLISKMLLVKIYMETKAFDALNSHLDTFEQFIRRKEVSDYHRSNFLNNIRYVRRIISLADFDVKGRRKLQSQITAEPILSEKNWLLEKCK